VESTLKISVVTPMYKAEQYVDEFYRRTTASVLKITNDYEIIFVNDGSPDQALQKALDIQKTDSKVKVVDLSRNFGHHKAIMTGLSFAKGEYVFLLDVDLEEEPEILGAFFAQLTADPDLSVVFGVQEARKGGFIERVGGSIFYTVFNKMSAVKVPENFVTARLMTLEYVKSLLQYKDREVFLGGLFQLAGYKQKPITIKKLCTAGSTYTPLKRAALFINALTSFTSYPLVFIALLGMAIMGVSACYTTYLVISHLINPTEISGWTSLIVSIWFLGGIMTLSIGIVGIYLSKIFSEVKERPYTTVRAVWQNGKKQHTDDT